MTIESQFGLSTVVVVWLAVLVGGHRHNSITPGVIVKTAELHTLLLPTSPIVVKQPARVRHQGGEPRISSDGEIRGHDGLFFPGPEAAVVER